MIFFLEATFIKYYTNLLFLKKGPCEIRKQIRELSRTFHPNKMKEIKFYM
ncbi:unnamed protein product [Paramecium octaurelia]|uniref:Uncharacterized protein n=1 Tax=Paramecium octaurelia TaxID=43137 RepID=A0A8S1VPS5_PAROT|nr:unnamed protein product [Paramecium octaurelia]